jgi:hypothetical protein
MRGFKCLRSADEFWRAYDELQLYVPALEPISKQVSADYSRFHFLRRTATVLSVLEGA